MRREWEGNIQKNRHPPAIGQVRWLEYLKSPMNYIGNKYRLLDQILPILPETDRFVDLFAGGLDVAINYPAQEIYCNDINYHLVDIYKAFQSIEYPALIEKLDAIIEEYHLTKEDPAGYLRLRYDYNHSAERDPIVLYLLMNFGFNYQLRFNAQHEYNTPFGKDRSSFNDAIRSRLPAFIERIKTFRFSSVDFRDFDYSVLRSGDLLYCDPPYTISVGSYNDGKRGFKGWNEQDDIALIQILDALSERGVLFAVSDVLVHKGDTNTALSEWADQYTIHDLRCSYRNSSYHLRDKTAETREVLITNF